MMDAEKDSENNQLNKLILSLCAPAGIESINYSLKILIKALKLYVENWCINRQHIDRGRERRK